VKLKETIRLKSLALQRECGYAVRVNILGPKPEFGVRGVGLTLNLADKNGDYAPTGCSKFHVKNVSQEKSTVNRGTTFLKGVQGNYEKKLIPTKAIPKQTKPQAISPPVSLPSTALPASSKPANASSEEAKPVSSKPAFGRVPAGLTITATGKICCIELTI
jgi:hypothetical protein